jgi:hypothetical protein
LEIPNVWSCLRRCAFDSIFQINTVQINEIFIIFGFFSADATNGKEEKDECTAEAIPAEKPLQK